MRKLINEKPGARAVFRFTGKKDKKKKKKKDDDDSDDEERKQQVPRMYVDFKGEILHAISLGGRKFLVYTAQSRLLLNLASYMYFLSFSRF